MSFLKRFKTPVYSNTGSVARDHLALERTFLAWLRTGLGFIALGIAVERFSQLDIPTLIKQLKAVNSDAPLAQPAPTNTGAKGHEKLLVGSLLGVGSASIGYGIVRHFSTMRLLEKGVFKPAYYGAGALGLAVTALAGASYGSMMKTAHHEDPASVK